MSAEFFVFGRFAVKIDAVPAAEGRNYCKLLEKKRLMW